MSKFIQQEMPDLNHTGKKETKHTTRKSAYHVRTLLIKHPFKRFYHF